MKVLVATLCPGAQVSVEHYLAVVETILLFKQELPEIEFKIGNIATSMGSYARNAFASKVLNDPTFSHVLFIDGDLGFRPSLIVKMLAFGKPLVGCVLPESCFDYRRFHNSRLAVDDAKTARYVATGYVGGDRALVTTDGAGGKQQPEFVDSFARVNYASGSLLLIRRDALQLMKDAFPQLWLPDPGANYRDSGLQGGVLQCFAGFQGSDGIFVRDDFAFCRRWIEGCGGEIWSCIDEEVVRVGDEPYIGQYLLKMKQEGVIVMDSNSPEAMHAAPNGASHESVQAS